MREIKFRAWGCASKKMYYYGFKELGEMDKLFVEGDIMQFTGLLDKNGKEIYENDIVACPQRRYKVLYDDKKGEYYGEQANGDSNYIEWSKFEVIGNIFEHPSLLTTKES